MAGVSDSGFAVYFAERVVTLRRAAYLLTGNWHDAEDVVQAAFVRLFSVWHRVRRDSADAYVRRVLINVFLSTQRGQVVREHPVADVPDTPAVDSVTDDRLAIGSALGSLTPGQRAVVVLRYWEGLSVAETAAALGVSEGTVKSQMHRALATYLPEDEPPIGLRVDDIMRHGRRRHRTWRAIPIAAAAVTVLAIGLPWTINSSTPAPERLPGGTTSSTSTSTPTGPPPQRAPFRLPPGHSQEEAATTLTKFGVENRLPAGRVTSYFGSRSDIAPPGPRPTCGMHMLWQEGDRYGYLFILHRTKGEHPATDFWLPVEPCAEPADRLSAYRCTAYPAPAGDVATSFEVDTNGNRMRGVVWDKKDPAGGADIRVTGVFYLPASGGLTAFPIMDDAPRLTRFPLAHADIARLIGMPQ